MTSWNDSQPLASLILIGIIAWTPLIAQSSPDSELLEGGPTAVVEALIVPAVQVSSCPLPTGSSVGLAWDGSHLWYSDFTTRRAYRLDPADCSVVTSIPLPGSFPTGLAWDGTYLWNSDSGNDRYYQIDTSDGSVVSSFASPGIWPSGLTHHAGNLWGADINCTNPVCPDRIDEVSGLGLVLHTFSPPGPFPAGLASDGLNIWHSDNSTDMVYQINPVDFSVIDQFPAPGNLTNDLAWDGRYLWMIEAAGDMLYKFDVGVPNLPRGQGFWKHQCSDNGFQQVSASQLDALFADIEAQSTAFSLCATAGCGQFEKVNNNKAMLPKALTHLQVAWLNIASGRLQPGASIDLSGLSGATTIGDAIAEVEATVCDGSSTRKDLARAKDIAEALSGISIDFDLGNDVSSVQMRAGESGSIVVGIVNMGTTPRNYDLSASGPWPVQLSETRITALPAGGVASVIVSSEAPPSVVPGSTADVRVIAIDRGSQVTLQRDVVLTFQVPGGSGGGAKKMLPPD